MENPKFDNCRNYVEINQFEAPGFDEPVASDNSGLVSMFSVLPEGFSPEYKLADSVEVMYQASDAEENTAYCRISVHVRGQFIQVYLINMRKKLSILFLNIPIIQKPWSILKFCFIGE